MKTTIKTEFVVKDDKVYYIEEPRLFSNPKVKSTEVHSLQPGLFGDSYAKLSDGRHIKIKDYGDLCLIRSSLNLLLPTKNSML